MEQRTRIPWCRRCDLPIIGTFLIAFKEFYCVGCGSSWGYFSEPTIEATPERVAAREELTAKFGEVSKPIIVRHSRVRDCTRCFGPEARSSDHDEHATEEEWAASHAAWEELRAMRKVPA